MKGWEQPVQVLLLCAAYFLVRYAVGRAGREKAQRKSEAEFQKIAEHRADSVDIDVPSYLRVVTGFVLLFWPLAIGYYLITLDRKDRP